MPEWPKKSFYRYTDNDNEPFWRYLHDPDLRKLASDSDFKAGTVIQTMARSALEEAQARTRLFQGGNFGGAGAWFQYIARK